MTNKGWNDIIGTTYDAYGNYKILLDTNGIGTLNPIRYRGYYYDVETGLYYIAKRYYDPEIGRFVSPNNINSVNPSIINGLNLYCYGKNNPVSNFNGTTKYNLYTPISVSNYNQVKKAANQNYVNTNNNYLKPHWKNKFFDTGAPGFLVIDNEGFQLINIGLSLYNGSFYFDSNESHSLNISLGNAGAYAGINYKKGIGVSANANVVSIGYDGRIVDVSFELLTVGATYMYKDGSFKFGYGAGLYGYTISVDFTELYKIIFGE